VNRNLVLVSTSRAQDAGYVAMSDAASIAEAINASYRMVGGHMVALLVAAFGVDGTPDRETADADLGTTFEVVADPRLVTTLERRGYAQVGAANRFERVETTLPLAIDVLAPSFTGRLETNQQHGALVVDEIPGLNFALQRPAVDLNLELRLSDGRMLRSKVAVPEPVAALCLKALAYGSRYAERDALDIWRLLEVAHAAGVRAADWPTGPTPTEAASALHHSFNSAPAAGLRDVARDTGVQTRVRALVVAVTARS
jgi:hypothetical protein